MFLAESQRPSARHRSARSPSRFKEAPGNCAFPESSQPAPIGSTGIPSPSEDPPVCRRALLRLAARMNRARVSALATDSDAQTPQEITPVRAVSIDVRSQNLSCNLFLNRNQLRQERPIAHSSPSQVRRNGLQQCLFLHL